MMTVNEARALLPKVGDTRWETPSVRVDKGPKPAPQRCTVVEVNRAHLWYTVKFENGFRESYKVPKLKPKSQGGILDD